MTAMTALIYTLGSFVLILVLARIKLPLSLAILSGAVAIGGLFGLGPGKIALAGLEGAIQPRTIALGIITVLLLLISETMRASGQMERMVSLAKSFFRRPAVTLAALPALIGLLPMPGGALFSAPLVAAAAGKEKDNGGLLSAINYWFRHIWETWWPLYPGVILAATLTKSSIGAFIAFQLPLGIFMLLAGFLILRRMHPSMHASSPPPNAGTKRQLASITSSIWIILLVWVVLTAAAKVLPLQELCGSNPEKAEKTADMIRRYIPLIVGLMVSLLWTMRMNRINRRGAGKIMAKRSIYAVAWLVICVMIYQKMLSTVDAAPRIAGELADLHVPPVVVVAILPFIAGMVTGLAVGFVGVSFPIVIGVVAGLPGTESARPYMVLAYACGHLGQMMSPLHLCQIVSNRFFKTNYASLYRHILPSAVVTATLAVAYFLVLRLCMG